jgi:GntR family transcriptional repressor for pyruvate dehydrogenase complex
VSFKTVAKPRLADQVSEQLKESIFKGQYRPGRRLPSEQQLMTVFGVSRVIVREAIRDLERAGLIEIRRGPQGGAFVLPMTHAAVSMVMQDTLRLGKAAVADIMEVRLTMEPIVAGLAAARATAADIDLLTQAVRDMPEIPGDEYVAWNVGFHRLLGKTSHNPMYEILVNILMDYTQDLLLSIKPADRVIHDTTSHPAILDRVQHQDSVGARRIMRAHLEDIVPILQGLEEVARRKSGR